MEKNHLQVIIRLKHLFRFSKYLGKWFDHIFLIRLALLFVFLEVIVQLSLLVV